jgi:hypothetical protein
LQDWNTWDGRRTAFCFRFFNVSFPYRPANNQFVSGEVLPPESPDFSGEFTRPVVALAINTASN